MGIDDLNCFNIYLDPSERMSITYRNWCNETHTHKVTPYERSQWDKRYRYRYGPIDDLPYPDWLNPYKIQNLDQTIDTTQPEIDFILPSTINDNHTEINNNIDIPSLAEENQNEELQEILGNAVPIMEVFNLEPIEELDNEVDSASVISQEIITSKKKKNRGKRIRKKKGQAKTIAPSKRRKPIGRQKDTSRSAKTIAPPRGMRLFHPEGLPDVSFESQISIDDLRGRHLKTLEAIFDRQRYNTVTYKKFKSLWKTINGKNSVRENTGSSHKALLDKNGKTVSGIFAHNGGMRYSKRTIPYIRYALKLIGFDVDY